MPLASRIGPGISFELAPFRNFREPPGHPLRLELKLMPQPAFWTDVADGKFNQGAGQKRRSVGCIKRLHRASWHGLNHCDLGILGSRMHQLTVEYHEENARHSEAGESLQLVTWYYGHA